MIDSKTLAVTDAAFDNFHPAVELGQAVAAERGGTVCALFNPDKDSDSGKTQPNKFNQPVKQRLYAINPGRSPVWHEMAMPNGTTATALATFDLTGVTNCLAASGQSISFLQPDTGRSETIGILTPRMGSIQRIAATEKSDSVVVVVGEPTSERSVLEIVRLRPDASGGSIIASVTASAKSSDKIERVAISADGTRILAATRSEIRLFDANLNMLMALPAPGYAGLNFNSDNSAIRSRGSDRFYEQDLRVQPQLIRARQLLDDWARYDEHNDLYSRATEEKDTAKSRSILKDATSKFPQDAVFLLLLANRDFYSPSNSDDINHAMELYDRSNLIDPFNPVTRYMRGKARSALGDNAGAAEDFSAAIELPHMLPAVTVIAGFIGINKAVAELSRKLTNQAEGEFFLRRAWTRLHTKDWQSAVDDIGWLRQHNVTSVAAFEFEAFALEKLGNMSASIESYRQAASTLKDAKGYGLEEFNGRLKEAGWRDLMLATFSVRIGDAQRMIGQLEEARAAYTAAREMIATGLASPDLTAPTRAALEKLSEQLAKQN